MNQETAANRTAAGSTADPPDMVLLEAVGPVRVLTINRPEKLNAADLAMQRRIIERLEEIAADTRARAVVLTGAGRLFCAGGDRVVAKATSEGRIPNPEDYTRVYGKLMRAMLTLPFPIVAAVNGGALGFGADLVALCDLVVIGEDAYLSDPHVLFGLPASPATQVIWPRLTSHAIAKELLTTSRKVGAQEALELGLVNRLCPRGRELATALDLAQAYGELPSVGITATKLGLNRPILDALTALGFGEESAAG